MPECNQILDTEEGEVDDDPRSYMKANRAKDEERAKEFRYGELNPGLLGPVTTNVNESEIS